MNDETAAPLRGRWGTLGHAAVEKVRTNSALNPLLWLVAVTLPSGILGAICTDPPLREVCMSLAILPVIAALIAYFIWMFRDPTKLQSEHYQLEQQRITLLGDDRNLGRPPVIEGDLAANTVLTEIEGLSPHG